MENKELREIYFFSDLDDSEIEMLKGSVQVKEYEAGDIIFKEGSSGSELYIVVSGKVGVNKMTGEGDQYRIITLEKGGIFGIMSFLDEIKHDATIIAEQKSRVIQIGKSAFDNIVHSNLPMAFKILRRLAMHLTGIVRKTNREYMDLMHMMFRKSK
ncbi:MAG: cyclic nucleotide-binding domain-containing protein [Nitrospirae bacterium]|nr:cyclic nucleotide-binding domain-containing protein [Nitrospirota bacterium]